MGASDALPTLILSKLEEQIERAQHLISLIPQDKLEWRPQSNTLRVCDLLGHLLECLAGLCATVYAVKTDRLAHFALLRDLPVNHCCGIKEATDRMEDYRLHIREGMELLVDDDLTKSIPTVFVADGEAVITLLLGNLEHLVNHKHQLFFYLKLMGVGVGTGDLYRIR